MLKGYIWIAEKKCADGDFLVVSFSASYIVRAEHHFGVGSLALAQDRCQDQGYHSSR